MSETLSCPPSNNTSRRGPWTRSETTFSNLYFKCAPALPTTHSNPVTLLPCRHASLYCSPSPSYAFLDPHPHSHPLTPQCVVRIHSSSFRISAWPRILAYPYRELLENTWTLKRWSGPDQFEDPTGDLMMLPTDMALLWDKGFRKHAEAFARDDALFEKEFATAFGKLLELGVPAFRKPFWKFW